MKEIDKGKKGRKKYVQMIKSGNPSPVSNESEIKCHQNTQSCKTHHATGL